MLTSPLRCPIQAAHVYKQLNSHLPFRNLNKHQGQHQSYKDSLRGQAGAGSRRYKGAGSSSAKSLNPTASS